MNRRHLFHQTALPARYLTSLGTVLLLLLRAEPSRTQASAASPRLDAIGVQGSTRFASDHIAAAAGLRTGAAVTREDLQAAADRLAQLGPLATIQYRLSTHATRAQGDY